MADKYYSFEETAKKLNLSEDDLLNLVSSGELHAFGRESKFKADEIDNYQSSHADDNGLESQVIELDDLPEDIELVDVAPETSEAAPEPEITLEDEPALADDNIALEETAPAAGINLEKDTPELDIAEPADEEIAIDEPAAPADDEIAVIDEPEDTPPTVAADEELESEETLAAEDSSLDGETVMTDSSGLGITEEITADEGDVNTQEITISEDAIAEDDISDNTTEAIADQDFTEELVTTSSRRMGASRRFSARSRVPLQKNESSAPKDTLWTILIAAVVLLMIYPGFLLVSVLCFDIANTRTSIGVGKQIIPETIGKRRPLYNVGHPVVPQFYSWIVQKKPFGDKKLHEWFGTRKTEPGGKTGLDHFVPYEERKEDCEKWLAERSGAAASTETAAEDAGDTATETAEDASEAENKTDAAEETKTEE